MSITKAKDLGDRLVVIVNSDKQAQLKKGKSFMPAAERVKLVRSLACVDAAIESMDEDRSVCKTLAAIHPDIFAKGGDQFVDNIPEATVCRELGIRMVDGLGLKIQSSSWLIDGAAKLVEEKAKLEADKAKLAADTAAAAAARDGKTEAKETAAASTTDKPVEKPVEKATENATRKVSDAAEAGGGSAKKKKGGKK